MGYNLKKITSIKEISKSKQYVFLNKDNLSKSLKDGFLLYMSPIDIINIEKDRIEVKSSNIKEDEFLYLTDNILPYSTIYEIEEKDEDFDFLTYMMDKEVLKLEQENIQLKRENKKLKKKERFLNKILKDNPKDSLIQKRQYILKEVDVFDEYILDVECSFYIYSDERKKVKAIADCSKYDITVQDETTCHPDDKFNIDIGIELAYQRAKTKMFLELIEKINK